MGWGGRGRGGGVAWQHPEFLRGRRKSLGFIGLRV